VGRAFAVKAVHKKQYAATHNFWKEANGTSGTDIDWIDVKAGTDSTYSAVIIASEDGHKKVVQFDAAGDNGAYAYWRTNITNQAAGTIELIFKYIDNGVGTTTFYLFDSAAGAIMMYIIIAHGDNTFRVYYGDGVGGHSNTSDACTADVWHHVRITFSCTTDTYSVWLNGDLVSDDNPFYDDLDGTSLDYYRIQMDSGAGANALRNYIDAIGYSWDANYKIGDNCFWRHYKESTDDFEGDDVGTQGTSITWVDSVDTAASFEIVPEFNEHKKVLRGYYSSGAGGDDNCYHTFASQAKTGWFEGWIKASDANIDNTLNLREGVAFIIGFRISGDQFQVFTGGAWRQATGSPTAVDATWYHFYIQWYDAATDTFDLWIDNVQYEDGTNCQANQTLGINRVLLYCYSATEYTYIDSPMSSLDSDTKADNRIFDYNSTYTSEDITSTITNVITENKLGLWRTGTMYSKTSYENSEIFVQVYDVNSVLAMEADLKKRDQIEGGMKYEYPLRDKNQDDLEHESSNTFTADAIHDPSDSTSMLKVILPNVGEEDGDLILVDADTKATTYSPTTIKYPDYKMLLDIADLADSCVIVHANGKCYLDDDKASGTVLDVDTAAHFDKMTKPVLVTDILEDINYFEIFGAFDRDTGVRFTKVIDNTGSDKKRSWRYTNNSFKSQADVDAYAAVLEGRATTIKIIKIEAQSIGGHNMGETMDYKYVKAPYNVPQANYYIIYEHIDFDQNENIIIMSEGMIEDSKYAAGYERNAAYTDSQAAGIYATDQVPINLSLYPGSGASFDSNGITTIKDQRAHMRLYTTVNIDEDRDLILDFVFRNGLHGARTTDGALTVVKWDTDGSANSVVIENNLNFDAVFTANSGFYHKSYTLSSSDLEADHMYYMNWENEETDNGNATTCRVTSVHATYYIKRSI